MVNKPVNCLYVPLWYRPLMIRSAGESCFFGDKSCRTVETCLEVFQTIIVKNTCDEREKNNQGAKESIHHDTTDVVDCGETGSVCDPVWASRWNPGSTETMCVPERLAGTFHKFTHMVWRACWLKVCLKSGEFILVYLAWWGQKWKWKWKLWLLIDGSVSHVFLQTGLKTEEEEFKLTTTLWTAESACQSVHHFGQDRNISTTGWTG